MNKKIWLFGLLAVLAVTGASAILLTYFGVINLGVNVEQSVTLTGTGCADNTCTGDTTIKGGETATYGLYSANDLSSVDVPIEITAAASPSDGGIEYTNIMYNLKATGTAGTEKRIRVLASDVGLSDLNSLSTMQWYQNVLSGYVSHVDVLIDTDGDGYKDDALVFEYAKVDNTNCDNAPYPTGEMNTFGDKGIVDSSAYAWLSSGDAGPCGGPTYYSHSLSDWKIGQTANGKYIDGSTAIIALEFEVDNWITDSEANIKDIEINSLPIGTIQVQAGNNILFYILAKADTAAVGSYTITSQVQAR